MLIITTQEDSDKEHNLVGFSNLHICFFFPNFKDFANALTNSVKLSDNNDI